MNRKNNKGRRIKSRKELSCFHGTVVDATERKCIVKGNWSSTERGDSFHIAFLIGRCSDSAPLPSARFPLAGKQAGSHKASRDSALHIAESQNHSGSVYDLAMAVTRTEHHNWHSTKLKMWLKMWPIGNEENMLQYIYHLASLAAAAGSHPWWLPTAGPSASRDNGAMHGRLSRVLSRKYLPLW